MRRPRPATPGAQDDVGDVRRVGRRVDPRLDRVQIDREVVAEQPEEVLGTYVVRRLDVPGLHVLTVLVVEVVVDGEQQPTSAHRVAQAAHGGLAGGFGQRRVLHRHEVERTGRERCLERVPADPLNAGAGPMGASRARYMATSEMSIAVTLQPR